MGEVFIKGHGRFKTQGDKPTQEELGKIKNFLKSICKSKISMRWIMNYG